MADGSERGELAVEKGYRSAFKSRDFRLYQAARLMVILGAEAQSVAVAWQVYALTHSALDLGYTGLALFLPGLFVMLADTRQTGMTAARLFCFATVCRLSAPLCCCGSLSARRRCSTDASGRSMPCWLGLD